MGAVGKENSHNVLEEGKLNGSICYGFTAELEFSATAADHPTVARWLKKRRNPTGLYPVLR